MNYFEFYGVPESFQPDEGLVKRKFYELSKLYHPDFYVNETEAKQQEILELSTLNNKAYGILSDSSKRIAYILELHQLIEEGEKYQLPQDFLMEMMEINEAILELETDPDEKMLEKLTLEVTVIENELRKESEAQQEQFDQADEDGKSSILLKIKDLWYRQKYLLRIKDSLNRFATRR